MSFMQPQIRFDEWLEVEANGTTWLPMDCASSAVMDFLELCEEGQFDGDELPATVRCDLLQYVDTTTDADEVTEVNKVSGYGVRLSAPGYMDCTEWSVYDTIAEAIADLLSMYCDEFDLSDYRSVCSELEQWPEFWEGYLLALAFTGHKEGQPDDNCDEPIFANPVGDIAEVVDMDELEGDLKEDDLLELYGDALSFFLSALPMIESDLRRAGSDFHFTRNGHGCGFWDGDWPEHGARLNELSTPYGTCELVQSVDGSFYTHN